MASSPDLQVRPNVTCTNANKRTAASRSRPSAFACCSRRSGANSILRALAVLFILRAIFSASSLTSIVTKTSGGGVELVLDLPPTLPPPTRQNQSHGQASSASSAAPERITAVRTDGFGACLLIKEDNHRLDEWIAYHLTVLPLRYLIVGIDPMSGQDPLPILRKWNRTLGLVIETWTDTDYIPDNAPTERQCNQWHDQNLFKNYVARQRWFMKRCAARLRRHGNVTWVTMIDSDEFWVYNAVTDGNVNATPRVATDIPEERLRLPDGGIDSGITIYDYLNGEREKYGFPPDPCYVAPRLTFSAVDSIPEERMKSNHTALGFDDVSHFNTLRFFHHASKNFIEMNHLGKPVLDLSRVPNLFNPLKHFKDPHYPLKGGLCGNPKDGRKYGWHHVRSVLRVNHYLGSMETYLARDDFRRSNASFLEKAALDRGADYGAVPWLGWFVDKVGRERAVELLEGAGKIAKFEPVDLCRNNRTDVTMPRAPHFFPSSRGGGWDH